MKPSFGRDFSWLVLLPLPSQVNQIFHTPCFAYNSKIYDPVVSATLPKIFRSFSREVSSKPSSHMTCNNQSLRPAHSGGAATFLGSVLLIDHFAIWRERLRRARPILTILVTVGNQGNSFLAAQLDLPANSSYFQLVCTYEQFTTFVYHSK